jgi:hypothetical protein
MRTKIVYLASSLLHRLFFEEANNDNNFDVEIEVETKLSVVMKKKQIEREHLKKASMSLCQNLNSRQS